MNDMQLALSRLKTLFPDLNCRAFTEADCWQIVDRFNVLVKMAPLVVDGYCGVGVHRGKFRPFVFLNSSLSGDLFLRAFLHELAHVALHESRGIRSVLYLQPSKMIETRQEFEAEVFALLALYPRKLFLELCDASPEDLEGFSQTLLIKRLEIFRRFGE